MASSNNAPLIGPANTFERYQKFGDDAAFNALGATNQSPQFS
jgi:hypothetical protein